MEPTPLQIAWFLLFFVLIAGYAVLDGFDLGVGVLHFTHRTEEERRLSINAIAPVWDGNEVWLLTGGGALFAAFPPVYATVFSGFYLALMLVLVGLILRAVSMEFRGKVDSPRWRAAWDVAFGVGSFLPALLFGVAVGNILRGLPLDASGEFAGTFLGLLNPFALLCGLVGLVMFVTHGAVWLAYRTTGDLQDRMLRMASRTWWAWVALFVLASAYGRFEAPWLYAATFGRPVFWVLLALVAACLGVTPALLAQRKALPALLATGTAIAATVGVGATALYPNLVPSLGGGVSLTIANSSSSPLTLQVMLVIALIGVPIVLGYTAFLYRVFRGPVVLDEASY